MKSSREQRLNVGQMEKFEGSRDLRNRFASKRSQPVPFIVTVGRWSEASRECEKERFERKSVRANLSPVFYAKASSSINRVR